MFPSEILELIMQCNVKSVRYIKLKDGRKSSPVHRTHFPVIGKSESAVISFLKDAHKGYDIIITELIWA